MSIATEITRITTARNTIRTKLTELGMVSAAADIDDCALAVDGIANLCRIRLPLRRIPIASYPMQMPSWAINGSLPMITARSRKRHPGSWREGRAEQARAVIICCMPAENGNKEKVYAVF